MGQSPAPPVGYGAEPWPQMHFPYILSPGNVFAGNSFGCLFVRMKNPSDQKQSALLECLDVTLSSGRPSSLHHSIIQFLN